MRGVGVIRLRPRRRAAASPRRCRWPPSRAARDRAPRAPPATPACAPRARARPPAAHTACAAARTRARSTWRSRTPCGALCARHATQVWSPELTPLQL